MSLNLLSENPSSLLSAEFVFVGLAAIGGMIVLCGLWLEYKFGDEDNEFPDLRSFWRAKRLTRRGEKLVMLGVFLEVVVAMVFAGLDVFEKYEINKKHNDLALFVGQRKITDDQASIIAGSLSGYPRGTIIMSGAEGDKDSSLLKKRIESIFSGLGFSIEQGQYAGKAPDSGLTILVDHKNPAPFLGGITNGFSVAKINGWQVYDVDGEQLDFPPNTNNILSTNKIIFVVGRKPHD